MEHQHGAEAAPVVDAASSCPNTPLSRTRTEHRRTVFHPFPSGQALTPPSTPCISSASFLSREVQQSRNLHATSADTSQRQREFQCLPASPPDEYEFFSAALPPRDNSSTSTPRRRCRSFIELLLATGCLSCQAASRQVLEQHVRRRKFKRSCEALTNFLQLRVGAETAPAFPGSQQLPVLVAAAALCTPKQQRRLLRGACTEGSCGSPAVSGGEYNAHGTSLPCSGASTCSPQTLQASSTAVSHASRAYPGGSSVPPTGRNDAGADVFSCAGRSSAVGADRRQEAAGHLPGRVLPASDKAEKACRSSLAAAAAVITQRMYPVQHIRVSRNGDGAPEIALQISLPEQCSKGVEGSAAVSRAEPGVLVSAAAGTHALRDSRSKGGCDEAAAFDGGRNKTSEEIGGPSVDQLPAASPDRRKVSRKKGEHTDIPDVEGCDMAKEEGSISALVGAKGLPNESTVLFPSVTAGRSSPPPRGGTLNSDASVVAAAVSTIGKSATTQEDSAARKKQGYASGEGGEDGRTLAKDGCRDMTPATAAPPIARLTIQQLKDVVGAAQLYCDTLGEQLKCFAENMPRLQRLSQLETFLQMSDRSLRLDGCTSTETRNPGSGDDKKSGRADRGRTGTTWSTAGDRNSSSGIDIGSGGNGAERPEDLGILKTANGDGPLVDSSGTTLAWPSTVPQRQVTFMSVLQQLRLPRDKDLTAAQVLGVHAAVDAAAAASREACQRSAPLQVAASSSGSEAAVPEPAGSAATPMVKKRKTGEPVDNKRGGKQQGSSDAAGGKEPEEALRVSAPGALKAPAADGDLRHNRRQGRGLKQQQPCRIVSLADVHDLSVLERSRESATVACCWQQHALRKKTVWPHKVEEAMNSAVAATGMSAIERTGKEIGRDSTESSVILLEHSEGSGDVETSTEAKMKRVVCPSKKRGGKGNAAEEGMQRGKSSAAESLDEEEEIVAGAREIEALCEAVGQESVKLLELVTFYENFSTECLKCATKDCAFSEGESRKNGEHV